jgi:outer membrane receptor for ferrienterochelin and colicins
MKKTTLLLTAGILLGIASVVTAAQTPDSNDPSEKNLKDMDIEELLNVKVSVASKKSEAVTEAPAIVTVVPHEDFTMYGDRDLLQLMQRQPSVYTRGSYMYPDNVASIRGDMPTHLDLHNLILFNGRPIRESGFGGVDFPVYTTFPLSSLDSVEVVRGPGSVLYGTNAFTGVINLKSRAIPDKPEASVSGEAGSYGEYDTTVSAGGREGDLGGVADIRIGGQDGYRYRMTDGQPAGHEVYGSHRDDDHSYSGTTHIQYQGFTFDMFAVDMETFHLGSLPWWSMPYHEFDVQKLFTNAGYRIPFDERTSLELNLTYNLHENRFENTSRWVGLNSSDVLGEATLFTNPIDNLNIALGYLQEYRSSYVTDRDDYQSIPIYRYRPQGFYAQGDYKLIDSVKLIAGAQWNESSQGYEDTVTRYGVIFTPFEKWGLKLLRGEAFRAPFALETDVYDIPVLVGNQDLKPETVTTYDAQIFYDDQKTYAAVTYFNSTIDDLIIRDASVNPASFKNGGEQRFQGVELEAKHLLTPHWHVLGSTMYQNNEQTDDLNPSTAPDYMVKLGTGYTWDWGTASIFCSHFSRPSGLDTEVIRNPEPEALYLLSATLRFDLAHWLGGPKGRATALFRVENLLDEDIWVTEYNRGGNPNSLPDGPGRTFYAGLTYKF